MFYNEFLNRFSIMLTETQQEKLKNARVLVFGVGGVGSAVANMLVRSGITHIGIVDFDKIDITNINRQMVANSLNVGKLKVDEMEMQLKTINPEVKVDKFPFKYGQETKDNINLTNYTYIVDCIDDMNAKKLLIKLAKQNNIPIICAMGAGNRFKGYPQFEIADIHKTSYDPVAKIIRKFCVEENIKKLNVCYTLQQSEKIDCKTIGSVVYYVVSMACCIVSKVINDVIEN